MDRTSSNPAPHHGVKPQTYLINWLIIYSTKALFHYSDHRTTIIYKKYQNWWSDLIYITPRLYSRFAFFSYIWMWWNISTNSSRATAEVRQHHRHKACRTTAHKYDTSPRSCRTRPAPTFSMMPPSCLHHWGPSIGPGVPPPCRPPPLWNSLPS